MIEEYPDLCHNIFKFDRQRQYCADALSLTGEGIFMDTLIDFLNCINKSACIIDRENYGLVYINQHMREELGDRIGCGCQGEKCYAVLHGKQEPCPFCGDSMDALTGFCEGAPCGFHTIEAEYRGRQYLIKLAASAGGPGGKTSPLGDGSFLVNECLQRSHSATDLDEAAELLISYIGERFGAHRVAIYERAGEDTFNNTYEWCASGVSPQKAVLQGEPACVLDLRAKQEGGCGPVFLDDVEELRERNLQAYTALKLRSVTRAAAGALYSEGKILGYVGVENPVRDMRDTLLSFLQVISYFIVSILKRRELVNRLEQMSYHDQLTGALNRHALSEASEREHCRSMGTVYCDISELKKINDHMGHSAGDALILHCYQMLKQVFPWKQVFRIGGDEFVIVCWNSEEGEFWEKVGSLRELVRQDEHHMAVGAVWTDQVPINIREQVMLADESMYEDKREYYCDMNAISAISAGRSRRLPMEEETEYPGPVSDFARFIRNNYYDAEALIRSLSLPDSSCYLYFGDMQSNLFYVSDNMKDTFGFQSNIVSNLLTVWEQRISAPDDREAYRKDIKDILDNKREVHDLRYRVTDKNGVQVWIRCRGLVTWDKDKNRPLFFSGYVSSQEQDFIVDRITNFPREYAAVTRLSELSSQDISATVIGFCLNYFTEINESWGRTVADRLLKEITSSLLDNLSGQMAFYRLDGLRFMAVANSRCQEGPEALVSRIRDIVVGYYREYGILGRTPCSLTILRYPEDGGSPQSALEHTLAMIALAKHAPEEDYIRYSGKAVQQQRDQGQMAFTLDRKVLDGYEDFRVVVQPVVQADNDRLVGGEILLRWKYQGEDVPPDVFIPLLERSKMIFRTGRWLFEQLVRICKRIIPYYPDFQLSMNLSYLQVLDQECLPFIRETLERYQLDGKHLVIELTGTHFGEAPERLEEFVLECRKLGIEMALDHFGRDSSSLTLLMSYPATIVKLDSELLCEAARSEDNVKLVRSITYAAHQFGKEVCAVGVDSEEARNIVRDVGCDLMQGCYYAPPLELPDFYQMLAEGH